MELLADATWARKIFTGTWDPAGATAMSTEPATGDILGEVGMADADDLAGSAARAAEVQPDWAATPGDRRAGVLRLAAQLLERHRDEVTSWVMRESGKTSAAASLEVSLAHDELVEAAPLATAPWASLLPTADAGRVSVARRVPVGVVAVIAPWNFPLNLAMRSVAPALACGNAVVLKPATETVVCCGVVIARLLEEAGLPEGVLHMLPGRGSELGTAFADDPNIDMLSFTGSTPIGRRLHEAAGRNLKRMVAELGGNNPFVVLDDADVDRAARAGAYGSFTHQGQICMAVGRHLVAETLAEPYVEAVTGIAEKLRVGDPMAGADLGPVINHQQAESIEDIVRRSVGQGAALRTGGGRDGLFVEPTVLAGVRPGMAAYDEEIFGPVVAVTAFADDDEAVALANGTPFGLVAGVHSGSLEHAEAVGGRLRAGMVHLNDQTVNDEVYAPFGGRRDSGAGGPFGALTNLDQFTEWQWVTVRRSQSEPPIG